MRGLDAQVELLKREQGVLGELGGQTEIYARGLAFGKTSAEAQMALLDGLRSRAEGLNAALGDLAARRRELERRLQKLRSELDQLRGAKGRERYTAVVEVEVAQAGRATPDTAMSGYGSVSRTYRRKEVRCCTRDEGGPLEAGGQAQASSHCKLLS